jgi:hypothetical protein
MERLANLLTDFTRGSLFQIATRRVAGHCAVISASSLPLANVRTLSHTSAFGRFRRVTTLKFGSIPKISMGRFRGGLTQLSVAPSCPFITPFE